jgi:hypothetical protein
MHINIRSFTLMNDTGYGTGMVLTEGYIQSPHFYRFVLVDRSRSCPVLTIFSAATSY